MPRPTSPAGAASAVPRGAASGVLVGTPRGDARVWLDAPVGRPSALLVLGHGAGGGIGAPDLLAVAAAAAAAGLMVARVEQPYLVAGRRSPAPAPALDEAWTAVVAALRLAHPAPPSRGKRSRRSSPDAAAALPSPDTRAASRRSRTGGPGVQVTAVGLPLVVGGRSSGARVACRTAAEVGAAAVVALAFPTRPPGRPDRPDRLGELALPPVPVLVVQGDRDPFGTPPPALGRTIVTIPGGDHSLRRVAYARGAAAAVVDWLAALGLTSP